MRCGMLFHDIGRCKKARVDPFQPCRRVVRVDQFLWLAGQLVAWQASLGWMAWREFESIPTAIAFGGNIHEVFAARMGS